MNIISTNSINIPLHSNIANLIYETSINISTVINAKIKSLVQNIISNVKTCNFQWHEHFIKRLEKCETQLDKFIPSFQIQNHYDQLMADINDKFNSPDCSWNKFNAWLDNNGHSHWFLELGNFLVKLPFKAARNILRLVVNIIKTAICVPLEILIHPLKAPLKLAKLLVSLAHNLTQPETWTKIGGSMLGTSLATATCTYNPVGVLSIGIGAALSISGISIGTLKTALFAEKHERWNCTKTYLIEQSKMITEDLLTGYCLGLLVYGVQKITRECQKMRLMKEHKKHFQQVQEQNDRLIHEINTKNSQTIDDINSQNRALIAESQTTYIDQTSREFLEKYRLPNPDRYNRGDQNFSVRWQLEKFQEVDFPMHDLPEGNLVIEHLQTGIIETKTDVWIEGYYTNIKMEIQDSVFYVNEFGRIVHIPAVYQYVPTWTPGRWDVAVTRTPIFDKFVGYNVASKGWTSPSLLEMPPLLPPPTLQTLPIEPSLAAAVNMSNSSAILLNTSLAVNDHKN